MRARADIVVVGMGAMGASTAYQLSKQNLRVICLEQFGLGHKLGSSHGESRIIRQACYEHSSYAPLSIRSYEILDEIEELTGRPHSIRCGGLMIGAPDCIPVAGSLKTARCHDLAYEMLGPAEMRQRFPSFDVPAEQVAFLEKRAGLVFPELLVSSWTAIAKQRGVDVREHQRVTAIEPGNGGVRVHGEGFVIDADQAIVTAGPWLDSLVPELRQFLSVERIVQHWFEPLASAAFLPQTFPVFYWDVGPHQLYGFPTVDPARRFVKVGLDSDRRRCSPDDVDHAVSAEELLKLDAALGTSIPALQSRYVRSQPCLWTVSGDRNLVVGRHPDYQQIIIAGGCSGRGFKFSPVVGEILTDMALRGSTRHDIGLLAVDRAIKPLRVGAPSRMSTSVT